MRKLTNIQEINEKYEKINKLTGNKRETWENKQINRKWMRNMRKLTNIQEMNEKYEEINKSTRKEWRTWEN